MTYPILWLLLDSFEEFGQVLFRWAELFSVEDGSWYAYKDSQDPLMRHQLRIQNVSSKKSIVVAPFVLLRVLEAGRTRAVLAIWPQSSHIQASVNVLFPKGRIVRRRHLLPCRLIRHRRTVANKEAFRALIESMRASPQCSQGTGSFAD